MRSRRSSAAKIRATAVSMFGSRNGSLSDFRRGWRNASISSAVAKPLRKSKRAIHSQPQISLHEIALPLSSSGGRMFQRLCTDYFICRTFADNSENDAHNQLTQD